MREFPSLASSAPLNPGGPRRSAPRRTLGAPSALSSVLALALLGTAVFLAVSTPSHAQSVEDEYRVKAAFLFHFTQLVEWPRGAEPSDAPLFLCVFGVDPFRGELDTAVEGKHISGRPLSVRRIRQAQDFVGCHVLFVGKNNDDKRVLVLLAGVRGSPVLTVGEADGFLEAGGIVRFCLDGGKVRFEINRPAADAAGLRISSRLLLLAKNVAERGGK